VTTGSLARVIGPIAVAEIYEVWGTYVLFTIVTATLVLSFVITIVFWRQLVTQVEAAAKKQGGTQPIYQLGELVEQVPEELVEGISMEKQ